MRPISKQTPAGAPELKRLREFDRVELLEDIPGTRALRKGRIGVILDVWETPILGYEVVVDDGDDQDNCSVLPHQVKFVDRPSFAHLKPPPAPSPDEVFLDVPAKDSET